MSVRSEHSGPVTTVVLSRPRVRNAVDGPTAQALADHFRAFDADRLPRVVGTARALDLVLTGRPVGAREALDLGLVSRVVPSGTAREEAERLAGELAALPQVCLRHDRLSLLEQEGLDETAALANELRHGRISLAHAADGVARFVAGDGRHGS